MTSAVSGGFRRFPAVFGGFGILCYSMTFRIDKFLRKVVVLLKMRDERISYVLEILIRRFFGDFRRF